MSDTIITVYTQPGCMPCRATKRILDAAGAAYTQIDVTENAAAAEQLRAEGHRQMPVVKVTLPDGVDVWSGHNADKVIAAAWLVTEGVTP